MKHSIRSAICAALCAGLAPRAAVAERDDRAALFADSAVVVSARPVALAAALGRVGTGWEKLARGVLPLPPAVSPFQPAVLATTGIAPERVIWAGLRALRGGVHLRAAIPLVEARVADALLQSAARLTGVELARSTRGDWGGWTRGGEVALARLDGDTLVLDVVFPGPTASPTPDDLARIVPLRPPRAWRGDRGVARRMGPTDALAVWTDLVLAPKLALLRGERQLSLALKNVDPVTKVKLAREGRNEITTCQHALDDAGATFDDARAALVVRGPDELGLEVSLGGRRAALDKLRALATRPATRALAEVGAGAELRLQLYAPLPILVGDAPARPRVELPPACPGPALTALALRSWPTLRWGKTSPLWVQALAQLRAAVVALAAPPEGRGLDPRQIVAVGELEPAARDKLDRLLAEGWAPTAPLRVGGRQLSAFGATGFAAAEGSVWAVEPSGDGRTGTVVAFGAREPLRAVFERVAAAAPAMRGPLLSASISEAGLGRVSYAVGSGAMAMIDQVTHVDAALALDDELVRLEATLALKAR